MQGTIFEGTISFPGQNTFVIDGTDRQQLPWKKEPQNRREKETGTYRVAGDKIHFDSPEATDSGWSFHGDFKYFMFKSKKEAMDKVASKALQYHLLEKDAAIILLIHPYFLGEKPSNHGTR